MLRDHKKEAQAFLKISHDFHLGHLPTESRHPMTLNLSQIVNNNLLEALSIMHKVDEFAFSKMLDYLPHIFELHQKIKTTFDNGFRVFLCGCGATGRLSLALETFYRELNPSLNDKVISFMAGGDVALIKSIESFEDHPEYGERQLIELGFKDGDLLLAITEGGETPFVIGACELAAKISKNNPFFIYCNPDDSLRNIKRSNDVIHNSSINKICLFVGPMSISGSTRMQASTVLMYGAGLALLGSYKNLQELKLQVESELNVFRQLSYSPLASFIEEESEIYLNAGYVLYQTPKRLGLSVLTDTTERSPTFSLQAFENGHDTDAKFSLAYLSVEGTENALEAWETMLYRKPRCLEWDHCLNRTGFDRLIGFDISSQSPRHLLKNQKVFQLKENQTQLIFSFAGKSYVWDLKTSNYLFKQIILKMLLNTHSTLIMGKLNRYEGNIMTWVKPTNNKLIDRAARYIDYLLQDVGVSKSYEEIVYKIFETVEELPETESIVLTTVRKLKN
jgi:N-acetylmuramic acid 6-phosphate etherase